MTFDRLAARVRALPPIVADLLVVAVVGAFTTADAAVNEPGCRQADALTWGLLVVSLAALACRRRGPVPVVCVTGAACAGWAPHGHIGELLNLPVVVALYTVAAGRSLLAPAVTRRVIEEFARLKAPEAAGAERLAVLTGREREVMALAAAGLSNDEIGKELIMSPLTAKTHVSDPCQPDHDETGRPRPGPAGGLHYVTLNRVSAALEIHHNVGSPAQAPAASPALAATT